ncbi:hypothetical protein B0H13DRAFT_1918698 [Mycena leptocephala]|nr:hypothetical protein B0H13DRAFT_1918698 [Mycena leptocephala]
MLLNAVYDGRRVSESSPAFTDSRKVRDFISAKKKIEHPHGMGWEGVLYHLNVRELKLPVRERYIHTAMLKNGIRLVVTMHPQIAMFIHNILSLNIDYTFKRVDGAMDEWEVAGFTERFKEQLFDTIRQVTGEPLKLAPFFPDAKCRVVIMDGEVPQAQGFAAFLVTYNDPKISSIWSRDETRMLSHSLKTCNPHFDRHIDELPQHIPAPVIRGLKSIMGLGSQAEVDAWHRFCTAQTDDAIKNWYAHKLANPWILPSINKFLSRISADDWDITPNHSNLVETAHAGRNAETSIGARLLDAILQAQARDDIKANELALIGRDGVMRKRWNGSADREKLSAQRKIWKTRKAAVRNDQLTSFDTLKAERDAGVEENRASLEREKILLSQIKSRQEEMKLDRHRTDLQEQVNDLRKDVDEEKSLRREWILRRGQIDKELEQLRKDGLAGVRIKGRRPAERPSEDDTSFPLFPPDDGVATMIGTDSPAFGPAVDSDPVSSNYSLNPELQCKSSNRSFAFPYSSTGPAAQDDSTPLQMIPGDLVSFGVSYGYESPDSVPGRDSIPSALSEGQPGPATDSSRSTIDMTSWVQSDFNNPSATFDSDWELFVANLDTTAFNMIAASGEYSGADPDELEYIGPPTNGQSVPVQPVPENEFVQGMDSGGDREIEGSSNWSDASSFKLSQVLPRLPPLSVASPSHTEAAEYQADETEDSIAPQDIDLNFSAKNIVTGKRMRTLSTRAAEAVTARPNKKGAHSR